VLNKFATSKYLIYSKDCWKKSSNLSRRGCDTALCSPWWQWKLYWSR